MPSPNIAFDQIPGSIRKPGKYFEFNTKLANRGLNANPQSVRILAPKIAAGTLVNLAQAKVFSDVEAAGLLGNGSIGHLMVRAALKAYPYGQYSVVAIDDAGAGVAATGTITITGPATGNGVLSALVGASSVEIAVVSGDTATVIAAALKAQFDRQPDLPVAATVALGVVTLTAKNKGTLGNGLKISAESTATGTAVAVVALAAGATDPDITNALGAVVAAGDTIVVSPFNDATNLVRLRTHLNFVSGPLEQRGAIGAYATTLTTGAATTLASGVNEGRITAALLRNTVQPSFEVAAAYAGVLASEEDPARPLNTLQLVGIAAPAVGDWLSRTEQESLLYNGVTPLEVGPGNKVQIVRAISTYTLDPQSIPDIALLDITTIRTLDYVRKECRIRIGLRFPREKLSERTEKKVRSELLDVLIKLEELEIVERVAQWQDYLIVERDSQDPNRLNARIPADVVNGLHVFAGRIDLFL